MSTVARTERGSITLAEPDPPADLRPDDTELWQRAAVGDRTAFADLFERHVGAVWNHAYRLTGSWSLAEDLTSSTFLTAWRRLAEVTLVRDSALPWLYGVAGNLARTERRRSGRFAGALRRVPVAEAVPDHAEQVVGRVDEERRLAAVLAAVAALPRAEREAVQLCLLGELSTADAASLLGVAETSVRSRISRARTRLRSVLEES